MKQDRRRGFTLLEMMVVVVIISIVATMAAVAYMSHLDRANVKMTRAKIRQACQQVDIYKLDTRRYPGALGELVPTYFEAVPQDAWGFDLLYEVTRGGGAYPYRVGSLGADNQQGGDGQNADIWNTDPATMQDQ
jgi:general secretion pathway protein G